MVDAHEFTSSLGGRWQRCHDCAPCRVCQPDRRRDQNTLTLSDGTDGWLLAHCQKSGCTFANIATAAGIRSGDYRPPDPAIVAQRRTKVATQNEERARQVERYWAERQPTSGTIAETYLRGRGITCDQHGTLRFHPKAWQGPSAKRQGFANVETLGGPRPVSTYTPARLCNCDTVRVLKDDGGRVLACVEGAGFHDPLKLAEGAQ